MPVQIITSMTHKIHSLRFYSNSFLDFTDIDRLIAISLSVLHYNITTLLPNQT